MIVWFRINSDPPTEFWSAEAAREFLTADARYRRLQNIGAVRAHTSVTGGGENANVTVGLDNGDGKLTALFSTPPLRSSAQVLMVSGGETVSLFAGLVSRVVLGGIVAITIEA